jgi:hypothetical protein
MKASWFYGSWMLLFALGIIIDQPATALPIRPLLLANQPVMSGSKTEQQQIQALIDRQMNSLRQENIAGYMNTISPSSPQYANTEKVLEVLVAQYDLTYEVNQVDFVNISNNSAKVRIIITTRKVQGPAFRDNKVVTLNDLVKAGGQWKFYSTEIEKIEYFN